MNKIKKAVRNPRRAFSYSLSLLKTAWYRFKYETVLKRAVFGKRFRVEGKLIIKGPGMVYMGDDVLCAGTVTPFTHSPEAEIRIMNGVFLNGTRFGAATSITVGSKCILADCRIMDTDFHSLRKDRHNEDAPIETAPVNIGENVWIGAQAAVLKGVSIGQNSVVGFGSVVSRDLGADIIAAGNPAKVIKPIPE